MKTCPGLRSGRAYRLVAPTPKLVFPAIKSTPRTPIRGWNLGVGGNVALGLVPSLGRSARSPALHCPAPTNSYPLTWPRRAIDGARAVPRDTGLDPRGGVCAAQGDHEHLGQPATKISYPGVPAPAGMSDWFENGLRSSLNSYAGCSWSAIKIQLTSWRASSGSSPEGRSSAFQSPRHRPTSPTYYNDGPRIDAVRNRGVRSRQMWQLKQARFSSTDGRIWVDHSDRVDRPAADNLGIRASASNPGIEGQRVFARRTWRQPSTALLRTPRLP